MTDELLREIASKYKTRSEFQKNDPSAYSNARRRRGKEFLDSICSHMYSNYSLPQLICKHITESLIGVKCLYNTRAIITPYELDVYFPDYKLAFEYDGKGWHVGEDSDRRTNNKLRLLKDKNITLIRIVENNRSYEQDIKSQLVSNLGILNNILNGKILTEDDINKVDCSEVLNFLAENNKHDIDSKIKTCSSIADFQRKYADTYRFLQRTNNLEKLKELKIRKEYSDDELIQKCSEVSCYKDFVQNYRWLYLRCYKRNILKIATSHMKKTQKRSTNS